MSHQQSHGEGSSKPYSNMRKIKNKLVLLGDVSVGKTSLATRYDDPSCRFQKNEMPLHVTSTMGAQFITLTLPVGENELQFDIWDTAGQERFKSLGALYYKTAKGALVVFDITVEKSFHRAKEWISELHQNAEPDIVISLVGNKTDLESERKVSREVRSA